MVRFRTRVYRQTNVNLTAGNAAQWRFSEPATESGPGRAVLSAQDRAYELTAVDSSDPGDGTVPSAASGAQIADYSGCFIACPLTGFDHQSDYNNATVRKALLDALVRLVEPVTAT